MGLALAQGWLAGKAGHICFSQLFLPSSIFLMSLSCSSIQPSSRLSRGVCLGGVRARADRENEEFHESCRVGFGDLHGFAALHFRGAAPILFSRISLPTPSSGAGTMNLFYYRRLYPEEFYDGRASIPDPILHKVITCDYECSVTAICAFTFDIHSTFTVFLTRFAILVETATCASERLWLRMGLTRL